MLTLAWLTVKLRSRAAVGRALSDLSYAAAISLLIAGGLVIGHSLARLARIARALPSPDA